MTTKKVGRPLLGTAPRICKTIALSQEVYERLLKIAEIRGVNIHRIINDAVMALPEEATNDRPA